MSIYNGSSAYIDDDIYDDSYEERSTRRTSMEPIRFFRPRAEIDTEPYEVDRCRKILPVMPGKYNALLDELNRIERLTDWGNVNFVLEAKNEMQWAREKINDLIEAKTDLSIANEDVAYYKAKYEAFKGREAVRRDVNSTEEEADTNAKRGEGNKFESKSGLSSRDNMKVAWLMQMAGFELDQIADLLGLATSTTEKYIKTAGKSVKVYNEEYDQERGTWITHEHSTSSLVIRFE